MARITIWFVRGLSESSEASGIDQRHLTMTFRASGYSRVHSVTNSGGDEGLGTTEECERDWQVPASCLLSRVGQEKWIRWSLGVRAGGLHECRA